MTPNDLAIRVVTDFRKQTASRNFDALECKLRCDMTAGSEDERLMKSLIGQALVDWANEIRRHGGPG